jgi:pimeloyl-ACP methyl ester carboxylesterase
MADGREDRRQLWIGRIRKALLCLAAFLVVLALLGRIYEVIAQHRAAALCPMIGTRVDVGGYQLILNCTGQGFPTVILESGALDSSRQWAKVQPEVSHVTRVCSYDRAGFGGSDPSPMPRSARQMATELHTALVKAGIQPPYVVVGHSFGGLVTQIFVSLYPDEIAGVVFEDSVHPEEVTKFPDNFPRSPVLAKFLRLTEPLGLPRFFGWCDRTAACPDCGKYTNAVLAEYDEYPESHEQAAAAATNLGNKPLAVLAHDPAIGLNGQRDDAFESAWTLWQQDLARRSTNSSLTVATGIGHEIQSDQPQLVINTILRVVQAARSEPAR